MSSLVPIPEGKGIAVSPPPKPPAPRGPFDLTGETVAGEFSFDPDHIWEIGPLGPRFAGYHRSTYQEVLLTIVRPNLLSDAAFAARFQEACGRASGASHQNLIRTLGAGVFGQSLYYATERIAAERLDEHLKSGIRFSTEEIVHVGQGICRGLLAAHAFGLVPILPTRASVYLTPEGKVKLGDLALASIVRDRCGVHELTGTWTSLSPEKARNEREGVASDVYSVGVILYELASGRPPFEGYDSNTSLIYQILNVPPPSPRRDASAISRDLERVILRCLAKDPKARPGGPEELFEELQGVREALRIGAKGDAPEDEGGDFEIHDDQILAEGGMGTLYKGRQKSLDRTVAIKVIRDLHSRNQDFRERFRGEAELLAQVRDGHVVQVFGAGTWKGRPFYAMEYVEGVDLDQRLSKGPPPAISEVLHIAQGIGSALAAAWKFKIIHRDIKPSNILLAGDGTVKLTDFGLAKSMRIPRRDTKVIMGTVGYLSPEQARGASLDVRSDLYSLGVVLYELVAGHPPFSMKDSETTILVKQSRGTVPPMGEHARVPEALRAIIAKCMAPTPEGRFQTPEEFLAALGEVPETRQALPEAATRQSQPTSGMNPSGAGRGEEDEAELDFRLALGMGDFRQALAIAEARFGRESAEFAGAELRARAADLHFLQARALDKFRARDWEGALDLYRTLVDMVEPRRRPEIKAVVELCARLDRIEDLVVAGSCMDALSAYRRLQAQYPSCGSVLDSCIAELKIKVEGQEVRQGE
ncbi:MAG TPA: serine/threonine-protein kinase [Planctomycetota bacterium]|nr:serine/threonine-protein kinase [Planctomycetota bacterium]